MKVVVLLAIFSLAPATLYILYSRTGGVASQKEMKFQKNLRYAFMGGVDAIDLAPLTDWPWVKVCAVTSGLSRDDLTKILGFEYKDFDELHWLPLSQFWTLIFIDKEREASWGMARPVTPVRIPRKDLADLKLAEGAKGLCVSREGRMEISRRVVNVGESPVTAQLIDAGAD